MKTKRTLSILLTICILISVFCISPFSALATGRVNIVYLKPHQTILQQFNEFPGSYFHVTYMGTDGMGELEMENVDGQYKETTPPSGGGEVETPKIYVLFLLPCNAWMNIHVTYGNDTDEYTFNVEAKYHFIDYVITDQFPSRYGYTFKGWADIENGEVRYQPSDKFTENKETTLYAVWKIEEFSINAYDENTKTATVFITTAGTYTVIFADYEGKGTVLTASITKDFSLGKGDKIMLWDNMTNLKTMCEAYIIK